MKKNNRFLQMVLLSAVCATFISCASQSNKKTTQTTLDKLIEDAFQIEKVSQADTSMAIEEEVALALLPDISLSVPGVGSLDLEPRFDIKVNRARVKPFFMGLVEGSAYNMILHPAVKGRITLNLKNVTVTDVMEAVRDVYGYDFERNKTGFQVFPNTLRTRIFRMNYLNVSRKGDSQMRVSSGQVTESINSTGNNRGNGNNRNTGNNTTLSISGSRIETKSDSNFWDELKNSLEAIIGNKEGRNVVVSPQSGMVVIRAMPHEMRTVDKFISQTQQFVQRQVIIEAKILEVQLNDKFQSGINWAALHTSTSGNSSVLAGQTGGGSIFGGAGVTGIAGSAGNLNPSSVTQPNSTSTSAFGGVFSLALNIGNDFSAFIEMLKSQGDVQVLSSPQVSTVNNQKAVIKVGKDEFFITDINSNTNTSTATTSTQNNIQLTPFFSGVALDVIPQISEQGDIILHVHPTVSTVTEETKNISVSTTSSLSVPLAVSSIRESDSIIRARSGQVVVIGGLMQNSIEKNTSGVPFLADLPLIGGLFRHTQDIMRKSELVILIKPVVVDTAQQMAQQVRKMKFRFSKLNTLNNVLDDSASSATKVKE